MKFSIIVPVYKVEAYLPECVESILHQDCGDFELILVDDGSPDNCPALCDAYAAGDSRVQVVHQPNGGLSDARNSGLALAAGDYILFVDSDDYIAGGALSRIAGTIEKAAQPDLVFLRAEKLFPDGAPAVVDPGLCAALFAGCDYDTVMQNLAGLSKYPAGAWSKAVKASLFAEGNLRFQKGLLSEDLDWTARVLQKARSFACDEGAYYFYRQGRAGSITNSVSEKNVEDMLSIVEKWGRKVPQTPFDETINAFMAYEYMIILANYCRLPIESRKVLYPHVKALWRILQCCVNPKLRLVSAAVRLLGIKGGAALLAAYMKIK